MSSAGCHVDRLCALTAIYLDDRLLTLDLTDTAQLAWNTQQGLVLYPVSPKVTFPILKRVHVLLTGFAASVAVSRLGALEKEDMLCFRHGQ